MCLADCKHLGQHLDEVKPEGSVNEAQQQVAFADKILLNKIDLVTEEEKTALKDRLKLINQFAVVIETEKSRAPLEKIMGLNSFNMESILVRIYNSIYVLHSVVSYIYNNNQLITHNSTIH